MKSSPYLLPICLGFLSSLSLYAQPLNVEIKGEAAILINADTGDILFEKNAYDLHFPASTTKVATALYALKFGKEHLDKTFVATQEALASVDHDTKKKSNYSIPAYWLEPDGSHIGLKKDEELTLKDLLHGMLISSGNDAANTIAQAIEGNIPTFIEKMNLYLNQIGCKNTTFYNPHGLHHPQHQTSAYDLALITKEALKEPLFCEIVSQTRFTRPKTNKQKAMTLIQTNRLLRPGKFFYSKAIGVKTGYHSKAKKTFIGAARFQDRTLIAVLLKYQERSQMYQDAIKLFDTAFNQPKVHHVLLKAGPKKYSQELEYANTSLQTYLAEDLSLDYYPAEDPQAKCLLYWDTLSLPISKGQKVGELQLVSQSSGAILKKASLFASEEVTIKWPMNWINWIKENFKNSPLLFSAIITFLISSFLLSIFYVWKKD